MTELNEQALAVRMLAAELSGEDLELSITSETEFAEAVERVLGEIRDAETMAEAIKLRTQELAGRADRFSQRSARLRDVLIGAFATAGIKTLRLPEATITVADAPAAAIVTDETALPANLFVSRVTRRPDMREIARRLSSGETVPGAALRNVPPRLTTRTK